VLSALGGRVFGSLGQASDHRGADLGVHVDANDDPADSLHDALDDFGKAFHDYSQPGANYSKPLFGIQVPIVIVVGGLLIGIPLMLVCAAKFRGFFRRRTEIAPDGVLDAAVEHASSHF
jgi:hypothetical protein